MEELGFAFDGRRCFDCPRETVGAAVRRWDPVRRRNVRWPWAWVPAWRWLGVAPCLCRAVLGFWPRNAGETR